MLLPWLSHTLTALKAPTWQGFGLLQTCVGMNDPTCDLPYEILAPGLCLEYKCPEKRVRVSQGSILSHLFFYFYFVMICWNQILTSCIFCFLHFLKISFFVILLNGFSIFRKSWEIFVPEKWTAKTGCWPQRGCLWVIYSCHDIMHCHNMKMIICYHLKKVHTYTAA